MPKKNQYLEHLQLYGETEVPAQDITSLKKYYGSLAEALDSTSSELGSRYHKVTKIQTIKKRNKKKSITSVQEIFQSQTVLNEKESETQKKVIYLFVYFIVKFLLINFVNLFSYFFRLIPFNSFLLIEMLHK